MLDFQYALFDGTKSDEVRNIIFFPKHGAQICHCCCLCLTQLSIAVGIPISHADSLNIDISKDDEGI